MCILASTRKSAAGSEAAAYSYVPIRIGTRGMSLDGNPASSAVRLAFCLIETPRSQFPEHCRQSLYLA
jgi:hypothetical protein